MADCQGNRQVPLAYHQGSFQIHLVNYQTNSEQENTMTQHGSTDRMLRLLLSLPLVTFIIACGGYDDEIDTLHDEIDLIREDIDILNGYLDDDAHAIDQLRMEITGLNTRIDEYERKIPHCLEAATVVDVKVTTYGETTIRREVDRDRDIWVSRTVLGRWHAEIEITFSKTPVGLDILNQWTTHFLPRGAYGTENAGQDHGHAYRWEQTGNIVTLHFAFHAGSLFAGTSAATYEESKANRPDIDWDNWAAYTIHFTLDWDTGRQFMEIPITPSEQILAWY